MSPMWFVATDSVLQGVFALITLVLALLAYKVYNFTEKQRYYYLSIGFFTLSAAFFVTAISIFIIVTHASNLFYQMLLKFDFVYLGHIFLTLFGYLGILLVAMRVRSKRIIMLLVSLLMVFLLFSYQNYLKFHIVAFVLLFFIALQFYLNLDKTRNFNTGLIFTSFYVMLCAEAFFLVAIYFPSFYVVARLFQLWGFTFLAYMFVRVLRHG